MEEEIVVNPKNLPYPDIGLEEFYKKFSSVEELSQSKEWKEIYSYYYSLSPAEKELKIYDDLGEYYAEVEAYDGHRQMQEIIKCVNDFSYFCHKYVKIRHPLHGTIPFIMYNFQKRVIENYGKNRFNILSKFRQGGLTTVTMVWALWRCLFQTDQRIMAISKTDREAISAGEVVKVAMENLPEWLKPQMGKNNEHEKQFSDTSSILWCYTPEASRGKSITVLIIDEAAFVPDMESHWKAIYPTISTGGAVCVVSTVNGMGNWYYDVYQEAKSGKNKFNVIDLDYWEHPNYNNPKWVQDTKANLGEKGWAQEVMRSFLGSGDTYISSNIIGELDHSTRTRIPVRSVFHKFSPVGYEDKDGQDGALWIFKEPVEGKEYIIGVDVAEGVGEDGDFSCFQVIETSTLEQVAEFYSNIVPQHIFAQMIHQIGYFYNTALVVIESNMGSAVCKTLQHDMSYENLYFDGNGRNPSPGIKVQPKNRPVILESLQHRLTNGTVSINSRRFVHELKTFVFNRMTKKAEAQKGKHDDAIIALSLALYVREDQMRNIPVGADVPEEMVQIFNSEVYDHIRKEIIEGSPKDLIEEEEEREFDPFFHPSEEDVLPGVLFDIKRPHENVLKEFGW